jgi:hypothetical protein
MIFFFLPFFVRKLLSGTLCNRLELEPYLMKGKRYRFGSKNRLLFVSDPRGFPFHLQEWGADDDRDLCAIEPMPGLFCGHQIVPNVFNFFLGVVLDHSVGTRPAWNGDESKISNPRRVISTHKERNEWMSTELLEEWKMWRTQDERCSTWHRWAQVGKVSTTCLTWSAQSTPLPLNAVCLA